MVNGEQFVITVSIRMQLILYVGSWVIPEPCHTLTMQCEIIIILKRALLDYFSPGGTDEPVWLVDVMCSTTENCLTYCQGCPSVRNEECFHTDDATLTCSKPSTCSHRQL